MHVQWLLFPSIRVGTGFNVWPGLGASPVQWYIQWYIQWPRLGAGPVPIAIQTTRDVHRLQVRYGVRLSLILSLSVSLCFNLSISLSLSLSLILSLILGLWVTIIT